MDILSPISLLQGFLAASGTVDSIATRLAAAELARLASAAADAAVDAASSDLAAATAAGDEALRQANVAVAAARSALAAARKSVADALVSLGHPVTVPDGDGTSSAVELVPGGPYAVRPVVDGTLPIPQPPAVPA